jgi:hypothetical protein
MATKTPTDYLDFNRFVVERLSKSDSDISLEESVAAFRAYQSEIARCRRDIQSAINELDAGGGSELDIQSIIARGREMLAAEGVTE